MLMELGLNCITMLQKSEPLHKFEVGYIHSKYFKYQYYQWNEIQIAQAVMSTHSGFQVDMLSK